MRWMKLQLNCYTRKLLFRACALAFCFLFALAASAEDDFLLDPDTAQAVTNLALRVSGVNATTATVDDNIAAILALLQSVRNANGNTSFRTVPYAFVGGSGSYANAGLGYVLSRALSETTLDQDSSRQHSFLYEIQRALYGSSGVPSANGALIPMFDSRSSDIISLLSTNFISSDQFAAEFNDVERYYLDSLTHLTFTGDDRLRVQDDDLYWMASNINSNVESSSYVIAGGVASLGVEIIPYLRDILDHMDKFKETDDEVPEIVDDAEEGATDNYDEQWEQVESEYEDLEAPSLSEDEYDEVYTPTDDPTTSDILEDVSTTVSHSAILTLVHPTRSSTSLPGIEVDFGRDSGFVSFCLRLNDLTEWLYPVCGLFFLSLKGIRMWRIVRTATVAATADPGSPPIVHLAWSPF